MTAPKTDAEFMKKLYARLWYEYQILVDEPMQQRYRGALLGLAVGDALGAALEFRSPGTFEPVTDMVGGGSFDLQAGEWTDDTSLALCLAESLIERREFDPADQLRRYVRWWREGHLSSTGRCFDIGTTTSAALRRFEKTGQSWCGSTDPMTAGNGSLMRLAAVPLFFCSNANAAIRMSGDSSRTTHGAAEAVDACRFLGGLILGALLGTSRAVLLSPGYAPVSGCWSAEPLNPAVAEVADGSYRRKDPPKIRGLGRASKCLEAALWAFSRSENFRDGALLAVNLGDDADTTGAVYGQLAGAFYGERGIPEQWRRKLAKRELLESMADRLYEVSRRN